MQHSSEWLLVYTTIAGLMTMLLAMSFGIGLGWNRVGLCNAGAAMIAFAATADASTTWGNVVINYSILSAVGLIFLGFVAEQVSIFMKRQSHS